MNAPESVNNPSERLNRERKSRTDVVGIFRANASVVRPVGALLVEINVEVIAAERRCSPDNNAQAGLSPA